MNFSPFIKWIGGKTQLLPKITPLLPEKYNWYFEPFAGGGSVFLNVAPKKAFVSDINQQLMNLYCTIAESVFELIDKIKELDSVPVYSEYYYKLRARFNDKIVLKELDIEQAALFLWLNKHCYNGLYRVNSKGLLNAAWNKHPNINTCDFENLLQIHDYFSLNDVNFLCCDFVYTCQHVEKGDLVYFDSPYMPIGNTEDFTKYTKERFTTADHLRLHDLFKTLDEKGAYLIMSNSDAPSVHGLYKDYNIKVVNARRNVNRNVNGRTGTEVIITNFDAAKSKHETNTPLFHFIEEGEDNERT